MSKNSNSYRKGNQLRGNMEHFMNKEYNIDYLKRASSTTLLPKGGRDSEKEDNDKSSPKILKIKLLEYLTSNEIIIATDKFQH